MSTQSTTATEAEQQHNNLEEVRQKLLDVIEYVDDPELKSDIVDWIERSFDTPADSIEEYVQSRLSELESEYTMAVLEEGGKAEEEFPSECEDCSHYGGACPMLHDKIVQSSMAAIEDDAESDSEYAREIRDLGRDFGCHRVPEFVSDFYEDDGKLISEGTELIAEVGIQTVESATDEPTARVPPTEVSDVDVDGAGGEN